MNVFLVNVGIYLALFRQVQGHLRVNMNKRKYVLATEKYISNFSVDFYIFPTLSFFSLSLSTKKKMIMYGMV